MKPEEWWPSDTGDDVDELVQVGDDEDLVGAGNGSLGDNTTNAECHTSDTEHDEDDMDDDPVVDEGDVCAANKWCAVGGASLLQAAGDTTRGSESSCSSTESLWQNEGAEESGENVGSHPLFELGVVGWSTRVVPAVANACKQTHCALVTPVAEHPDGDQTDQPHELFLAGPDDHGVTREESEWNTDVAERDGDLHNLAKVECHTSKSLQDGEVTAAVAPKTEVEKKGGLNVTNELEKEQLLVGGTWALRSGLHLPNECAA